MLEWVRQHWLELKQTDTRPTGRQWASSLLAGVVMCGGMWALLGGMRGRTSGLGTGVVLGVCAAGMLLSGCVGRNIGNALGRSRGPAALVQVATVLACLAAGLVMVGFKGVAVAVFDSPYLPMLIMLVLSIATTFAMRNPASDKAACAKCSYPFIEENPPERCPECGGYWLRVGGRKLPKPSMQPRVRSAMIVIGVFLAGLLFLPALGTNRIMPTFYLRWVATSESWRAGPAFRELATRSLNAAEVRELSEHLLETSKHDIRTPYFGMTWLEGLATGGGLPADLRERYFAEMRTPVLRVSMPMQSGTTGAAIVGFVRRAQISPRDDAYALVRSLEVVGPDGATLPTSGGLVGSLLVPSRGTLVSPFQASIGTDVLTPQFRSGFPNVAFRPPTPGKYVVRAEVWVAVMPAGMWVTWKPAVNERGEINAPPGTLWIKKYLLEETVAVR